LIALSIIGLLSAVLPALLSGCAPGGADLPVKAAPGASLPRLSPGAQPVLSWVEPADDGHRLMYAAYRDGGWAEPRQAAAGTGWFINWADFPSVVRLPDGRMAAHWLQREGTEAYAYGVRIALTDDGGAWGPATTPHDDGTPTEHGFVSLFPLGTGVGAVWLDGRRMAGDPPGGMTVRGARLDAAGQVGDQWLIDNLACDCCQTGVAAGPLGPVVAYRDRTPEEIRDISVSVLRSEGWSPPVRVAADGWEIAACPVNGPAVGASDDTVFVAWFTAATGRARVRAAASRDGGLRFGPAMDLASGPVLGRVGLAVLPGQRAAVSWVESGTAGRDRLRYRIITPDGPGPTRDVAELGASRAAGVPQMAAAGDALVFAWTETGEAPSRIRSVTLPVP
jgi:hypothetical protein